ncbi:MAG: glycosyltransferase family 2 protein [Ruminococcus sp.]|nr:glycosyltransferase family 2 protein [Ruminococcus sp.]MDD6709228.1 glycosyltransferase family 2 protein [Ruminococcus sp.]
MPDAFIVFDTDNIVDCNYVSEINKTFNNGYQVITGYRNTKNYGDNWISSGYGLWFLREAMYLNQPRWKIGSSYGVSGTGFLFSSKVLEECGGWNFHLLTEDIEFTTDCIVNNRKIGYCPKAMFYDEQPTSFKQSVTQRLRWSKGYLQVLGKYGKRLFKCTLKGKFSAFDMLMNITPATVLSWVSIIVNILAIVVSIIRSDSVSTILLSLGQSAMNLYLTMFFIGTITTITEWKKICCSNIKKVLYTFIFPIFMITYILISVIAPFTKSEWKPINHNKSLTLNDLKSYRKDVELN